MDLAMGGRYARSAHAEQTLNVLWLNIDEVTWGNEHKRVIYCLKCGSHPQERVVVWIWTVGDYRQPEPCERSLSPDHMDLFAASALECARGTQSHRDTMDRHQCLVAPHAG
jgi:hypothetical protein